MAGRPPQTVCRAINGRGGAWSADDRLVFAADAATALSIVSASQAAIHDRSLSSVRVISRTAGRKCCATADCCCSSGAATRGAGYLRHFAERPGELRHHSCDLRLRHRHQPDLLFVLDGELRRAAARTPTGPALRRGRPGGAQGQHVEHDELARLGLEQRRAGTWSRGGGLSELVWFDRRGIRLGTAGPPDRYVDFRLAPDERRVALARVDPVSDTADLGMLDLGRNFVTALTSSSQTDASPIWSSDR